MELIHDLNLAQGGISCQHHYCVDRSFLEAETMICLPAVLSVASSAMGLQTGLGLVGTAVMQITIWIGAGRYCCNTNNE